MRSRLYLKLYVAFVAIGLFCVLSAAGAATLLRGERAPVPDVARGAAQLFVETLPTEGLDAEVARRAELLGGGVGLWTASGDPLAVAGQDLAPPTGEHAREGWFGGPGFWGVRLQLPDQRWLAVVTAHRPDAVQHRRFLFSLLAIAVALGLGCYPLARSVTARLERLQHGVAAWGAGALDVRVPVEGRDEVAAVAETFNTAAERVAGLVVAQRRVLASASHELRSPLARVRLALELTAEEPAADERRALVDEASVDVDELDGLIEDLLLAARLDHGPVLQRRAVDLAALVRGEGERAGAAVSVVPTEVMGDPRLLQRLVRNLVENARRHGGGEVELTLGPGSDPGEVAVTVADRGPGVPAEERQRIFEPFYRPPRHHEGADGGVGLGLALVRGIARAHGGDATVAERAGGGSVFSVRLPTA